MTDQHAELDAALERVIAAARAHLAAVKAAQGRVDDDEVWQAYVALNNASYEYDELLLDAFGEVTPWDVEAIDPDEADERFGVGADGCRGADRPAPAGDLGAPAPRLPGAQRRRAAPGWPRRPGASGTAGRATSRRRWRASARRCWSCCRSATARSARWTSRSWSRSTAWSSSARWTRRWTRSRSTTTTRSARSSRRADDRLVARLDEHPFLRRSTTSRRPRPGAGH